MSLNTYPYNPFPASTDKLDEAHNADLQAEVDQLKEDTGELQEDVEKLETDKTDTTVIAPTFDAEAGTYDVGDLVTYEGKLYEFTSSHSTAGAWDPTEVTEKTVADEIGTVKSGLTNLRNDVEGTWEELTFADVVTLSQDVTTTGTPKAYRRGNRIRLHFDVSGTLTMGAGGSKTIGTLKTAYKPTRFNYLPTLANKTSSGIVMYPFMYSISSNSGNINLIAGTGELGNANNSWMGNDSVEIVYELS